MVFTPETDVNVPTEVGWPNRFVTIKTSGTPKSLWTQKYLSSTSENSNVAPRNAGAAAVALIVKLGTATVDPGPTPRAAHAARNPEVALLHAMACLTLKVFVHAASNSRTNRPPRSLPAR